MHQIFSGHRNYGQIWMVKGTALIFSLAFLFFSQLVHAKTLVVGKSQSDTNSIAEAVRLAHNGDNIIVKHGIYREPELIVNKKLSIVGIGWPIIDGANTHQVMTVRANGVTISGLVIMNTGVSHVSDRAGVRFDNVRDGAIDHCLLVNNLFGIYFSHSRNCRAQNNWIAGYAKSEGSAGNGIHLWHCTNMLIKDNQVSIQRDGIYLEFVTHSMIAGNICQGNLRYGLHFMFSDGDEYRSNTFAKNGAGVAVMYSQGVNMYNNAFLRNWGAASYGLLIKDLKNSKIAQNKFMRNTIGMQCDGIGRTTIEKNDFLENGHALKISSYCSEAVFQQNNFMSNCFDLSTSAVAPACQFKENFWDSNESFDLDRDGYSDCTYQPIKLSSWLVEHYPSASMLLRSPLFDLLDLSEKALPVLSIQTLSDTKPQMRKVKWEMPPSL